MASSQVLPCPWDLLTWVLLLLHLHVVKGMQEATSFHMLCFTLYAFAVDLRADVAESTQVSLLHEALTSLCLGRCCCLQFGHQLI
jgi:hypothetical protein